MDLEPLQCYSIIYRVDFKNRFNQKYKDIPSVFGTQPMPIIKEALKYVSEGDALDLGVGNGRNTIFLLSKNFNVTGVDMSKEGISLWSDPHILDKILNLSILTSSN